MTPASPGTVRLASPDPSAGPLIDPDYLGDERDVAVMTEGLRIARLIGSRDVLAGVRGDEAQPGAGASTTQAPAESALTICRPWTPSCASTGSRDCASPTHPSCRRPSRQHQRHRLRDRREGRRAHLRRVTSSSAPPSMRSKIPLGRARRAAARYSAALCPRANTRRCLETMCARGWTRCLTSLSFTGHPSAGWARS
ncbi:MAG: hypothetical protein H7270_07870 [Dermatophilaceae bacterium]|nr:hypothetical protein [Dermatophilaceae bacterium]